MLFYSLIEKKGLDYNGILKIFDCIVKTAELKNTGIKKVLSVLDTEYQGIKIAYESYLFDKNIKIITTQGLKIYMASETFKNSESFKIFEVDTTKEREDAELSVRAMCINVTGARKDEILVGVHGISKNSIIKIVSGLVPPMKDYLDNIRLFPDLWEIFLSKLSILDFFSNMTLYNRSIWLSNNEKSGEYDIAEVDNLYVEVLDIGNSKFQNLEPEQITELLSGNSEGSGFWTAMEIRSMFPFKPGSKGLKGRSSLIFYLRFWKISTTYGKVKNFEGLVYNFKKSKLEEDVRNCDIILFRNIPSENNKKQKFGVVLDKFEKVESYFELLEEIKNYKKDHINFVIEGCKNFTPAGFKSLLQKIIRYAPLYVVIQNKNIDSNLVLHVVFTLLLTNPGSFVPDIQRFVSGQESAIKRLAISIIEDSSISNESDILKLGVMSFLSQRMQGSSSNKWKPNKKEYKFLVDLCTETLNTTKTYVHNLQKGSEISPYFLSIDNTDLENFSSLLDIIRSFESDIIMVRFFAYNKGKTINGSEERPNVMKLEHCIDQHWAPEFVYFLPIELVDKYKRDGSKPFSRLFKKVFIDVTGYNIKRKASGLSNRKEEKDEELIREVKKAQELVLISKQIETKKLSTLEKTFRITSTLDISWIAGLVGTIEIYSRPPVMVTLKPEDPYQYVAIRRPARGIKDSRLTDEQTEQSILKVKNDLKKFGLTLNKASAPVPYLKDYKLKLKDDEYIFVKGKEEKTWDELSKVDVRLPYHNSTKINFVNCLKLTGDGIQIDAFNKLETILENYPRKVIQRLLSYISSNRKIIEISRLSKDGGGTSTTVTIEDVGVCQILLYITLLFPRAIERSQGFVSKFNVRIYPFFWKIRESIVNYMSHKKISNMSKVSSGWKKFEDNSGRIMRSYQVDTLDEMIEKNKNSKKGHFIWMTVGLGKSLVALSYLKYLGEKQKLSKYIIYTLPKSALESIITEIDYFKIPINLLLPIKSWKKHPKSHLSKNNSEIIPFHINIIEHDHLRLLADEIASKSSESIVIIDEVHKVLNDTKRTSMALEMSRLSIDFVAMTGTPIIDSNTYKLIWWLEQIVNFEVNEKNFWVAANAMISKKVNTGVSTDRSEVNVEMTENERKKYTKFVPPNMGGSNTHPNSQDIKAAFELCYKICDREMVQQTLNFLKNKKGVMLVAQNTNHQNLLKQMLIDRNIKSQDIYMLQKDESIFMTDESIKKKKTHDYKVVIVSLRKSEGYTLTRLQAMVTCVYPSNLAVREQLEGRINRVSQNAKIIYYRTVHTGILTYVLQKHKDAASLSAVLSALADEIDISED